MATPLTCRQRLDAETMKVEGKLSVEPFDQITAVTAGKRCSGICRDLRPSFILMVHQPLMPWSVGQVSNGISTTRCWSTPTPRPRASNY